MTTCDLFVCLGETSCKYEYLSDSEIRASVVCLWLAVCVRVSAVAGQCVWRAEENLHTSSGEWEEESESEAVPGGAWLSVDGTRSTALVCRCVW